MRSRIRRWIALLVILACGSISQSAQAQGSPELTWRNDWRRVGPVEYVLTPTFAAGSAIVTFVLPPPKEAFWTRLILFDALARKSLRSHTSSGRAIAATLSDASFLLSGAQSLVIDPVIVAGVHHKSWDVAWQTHVIGAQSYAFTVLLNSISKRVFARQRPYAAECEEDLEYSSSCESHDRFHSFYSGHSAFTAAGAGLVCAHHTHVPLYGGDFRDTGACIGALGLTLLTGILRITADRHWATDVLTGHLIGFFTGYLIPTALYYQSFRAEPIESTDQTQVTSAPIMLNWGSTF